MRKVIGFTKEFRRHGTHMGSRGYLAVGLSVGHHRRVTMMVHRIVMETFVGPLPNGMETRHLDGNKMNAGLTNLKYGTGKENAADRDRHGTSARGATHGWVTHPEAICRGEKNGFAKLTEADALSIYSDTRARKVIAAEFGVSADNVGLIQRGKAWRHVTAGDLSTPLR